MKKNKLAVILTTVLLLVAWSASAIEVIEPTFVLADFPTGEFTITPQMENKLQEVLRYARQNPNRDCYIAGWVSDPPQYRSNNQNNQRALAANRARTIAEWLVSHGVPSDRIKIFAKVGRGMDAYLPGGTNYSDQGVDIYFFDSTIGPGWEDIAWKLNFECPTGYEARILNKNAVINNAILEITVEAVCVATGPEVTRIDPTIPPPKEPRDKGVLGDPRYWGYTIPSTLAGCGVGYAISGVEGGKGGQAGDTRGGDGGGVCADDATCIITGCLIGWGAGQLGYWIDSSVRESRNDRLSNRRDR